MLLMSPKQALDIVQKYSPCPHYSVDRTLGDGKTWCLCEDCGSTIQQANLDKAESRFEEYANAILALRQLIKE